MDTETLIKELEFNAVRSGGPGGQHANKVSSKIVLVFDLERSKALSDKEKDLLFKQLKNKLSKNDLLIVSCDKTRSQHQNKEIAIDRFLQIIGAALKVPKKRKATKPGRKSVMSRLEKKKKLAFKKVLRRKPKME